ncbi:hypothetical protein SLA2020_010000 [Shorea laevis]
MAVSGRKEDFGPGQEHNRLLSWKFRKGRGLRLFATISDFLMMVDKVYKEVKDARMKPKNTSIKDKEGASVPVSPNNLQLSYLENQQPFKDMCEHLFPAIQIRCGESFSSDDESP